MVIIFIIKTIRIILLGALFTIVAGLAVWAGSPSQVLLTWQNDPHTTMTISFRTDTSASGYLYYTDDWEAPLDRWEKVTTQPFTFTETAAWIHTIELTNLEPNSKYWVVIGNQHSELDPFFFQTAPKEPQEITFIAGADSNRAEPAVQRAVNKLAAQEDPAFVIFTGDLINAALSDKEWDRWFDDWHELMLTEDGRRIPIIPAVGNHEVDGFYHKTPDEAPFYYNRFALPGNRQYYYLDYGPMGIITLDSAHTTPITGEQQEWLAETLHRNQARPWLIVHYHVAAWGGVADALYRSSNPARVIAKAVQREWVPLFEQYGVDVVNEGHQHTCKITHPLTQTGHLRNQLNEMIHLAMLNAEKEYDPEKSYSPWTNQTLQKLSIGNWMEAGFSSMIEGVYALLYEQALYAKQIGNMSRDRIFEMFAETTFFQLFWREIGNQPGFEHLINPVTGVTYIGDGGWGGMPLNAPKPVEDTWYLKEGHQKHHFFRLTLSEDWKELSIEPVFLEGGRGNKHILNKR